MIISQNEIIECMTVDDYLSVNSIKDATIRKGELYLANTFLGETLYASILASKTGEGTFSESKYQTLYDQYLKRLFSEYILYVSLDEMVLKIANRGINTGQSLDALQAYKGALAKELDRSKAMLDVFLKDNPLYPNYLGNNIKSTEVTIKSRQFGGFIIEK